MNPIQSVTSVFRNYVNFRGRAQRSEFWWFVLFSIVVSAILSMLASVARPLEVLEFIFFLVVLLPSLAVTARRLHDTNRTAWWMLLYLIPILGFTVLVTLFLVVLGMDVLEPWETNDVEWGILGIIFLIWFLGSIAAWIVLLVFQIMPGTVGPNRYGPDPLRPDLGTQTPGPAFTGSVPPYVPPPTGGYTAPGGPPPAPLAPPPSGEQRRYCTQCGTQLQADARFCTYCGASV